MIVIEMKMRMRISVGGDLVRGAVEEVEA